MRPPLVVSLYPTKKRRWRHAIISGRLSEGVAMKSHESPNSNRALVARAFTVIEDIVHIGLGLLLAGSAVVLINTQLQLGGWSLDIFSS